MGSVRVPAGRLYRGCCRDVLVRALEAQDLRTALAAIRTAVDVMGEARQYMELRGELSGEMGQAKTPEWPDARIVITPEPAPFPQQWPPPALPAPQDGRE